jgi:mRNA interferase MazF
MILISLLPMESKKMNRGEIYLADLDPTAGTEIKKRRPVLIVSNNANNKMASTVTIVPITSNIKKVYPFEVLLETQDTGLLKPSKAQCHQIRTISKIRMQRGKIGNANNKVMLKINSAVRLHLNIE